MNLVCPRNTQETLARDCAALGVVPGDTVMVHASLRAVGPLLAGPDTLIAAILQALGEAGTMMVYLGCPSPYDDIGRGLYPPEDERFIEEHCPPFDPYLTRASRDFGVLPEFFRGHPQVRCSANAGMRMGAVGARADFLTRDHGPNYGLGEGSPLARLCDVGGKVLLVGSDLDQVTLLHYAEAVAPIEGKRLAHVRVPVRRGGVRVWLERRGVRHDERHQGLARAVLRRDRRGLPRRRAGAQRACRPGDLPPAAGPGAGRLRGADHDRDRGAARLSARTCPEGHARRDMGFGACP
ncbi:aminoglycoside N(3)-acetyltransferase [Nannocystis pusilla]|uniref:aminoglycoside N(3)-acetyltransferase n=1 Tax=Nannocystis pusilla TaxID=889268 RepID=UPI003DA50AD1